MNYEMSYGRYAVGIDLGTTNCSVCYLDLESEEARPVMFGISQLVAVGEIGSEYLLPSFCYLPGEHELPDGAIKLPWNGHLKHAVGKFAREQGALVPERLVASAKSWLAHSGVNRRGRILPWGSELGSQMVSPLQVSAFYLEHIKNAWDAVFHKVTDKDGSPCKLAEQNVVVTVPASFDETARTLTLEAASMAGIRHLTLLEEPLAAFYSWLYRNEGVWKAAVPVGAQILVVDVGGGTTDLSLVEIEEGYVLRRTAVGEHLLLGGDNMDMTLAHIAEQNWKAKLPQRQWAQLCQECRRAKEILLSDDGKEEAVVRISGPGSSLFAGAKTYRFTKEDVTKVILDGFFPVLDVDAPLPERRHGIQEMGLPYAQDAAVTRYILQFLRSGKGIVKPTHVLFNGGAMLPEILRSRVLDVIGNWCCARPVELPSFNLSLAVAEGASCYGLARTGRSLRVKGGIARAYYLEVEGDEKDKLICVMPRDTEEGVICTLENASFKLRTNRPVLFPLYSSATRLGDKVGDIVEKDDSISTLLPLTTALKFGRASRQLEVEVTVSSRLAETGVLEVWCSSRESEHKYPLSFELRPGEHDVQLEGITLDEAVLASMRQACVDCFEGKAKPDVIMKSLEEASNSRRDEWNGDVLRKLADLLLANTDWRKRSAEHEARWLNLLGFSMRPGFGVAGDEWRVNEAWKLWFGGPLNAKNKDVQVQWFIFWRRIAAGLKPGQQDQFAGEIAKQILGSAGDIRVRPDEVVGLEMWRAFAAAERMPVSRKLKLLQLLLVKYGRFQEPLFWIVARLVARRPFHGGTDSVIPASKLENLIPSLEAKCNQAGYPHAAQFALANAVRLTGVRTVDVSEEIRRRVSQKLVKIGADETLARMPLEIIEDSDAARGEMLGDKLPLGLVLA